jgi:hypothetical protein
MRKIRILGVAFFAVLAFGAIAATNASAAQWLINGAAITTAQHVTTEGTWLLRGLGFFGSEIHVVCNGILLGTVGPGDKDLVSAVTDLEGHANLHCEVLSTLCEGKLALVLAENLPWETLLLEPKANEFIDHFKEDLSEPKGKPAFLLECTLPLGVKSKELCESTEILTHALQNVTGGVLGEILEELSTKCTNANTVSHISGHGIVKALTGTLTVSK